MRAAVALLLSLSLTGCFPHSARNRTYAKLTEGAVLAGGIGLLYFANSAADCDMRSRPGQPPTDCRSNADLATTIGLSMVLAGLVGFIATVSTTPDDQPPPPPPLPPPPASIATDPAR